MGNGFLKDLPEMWDGRARKSRKKKKPAPKVNHEGPVLYMRVRCPKCRSEKCPVYDSSHLPIRYHKCTDCGYNFKSIEKN